MLKNAIQNGRVKPDSRVHESWLVRPSTGVRFLGSGVWLAKDEDPQFEIEPLHGQLREGTYEFVIRGAETGETPLRPRFYFDTGSGYDETGSTQLPAISGTGKVLIRIPAGTQRVRFDPIAQPGPFVLHDIAARRLGVADVISMIRDRPSGRRSALAALMSGGSDKLIRIAEADTGAAPKSDYATWLKHYEPTVAASAARIRKHIAALPHRPTISVVMPVYNSNPVWLKEAVESLQQQVYRHWELCVVDDCSPDTQPFELLTDLARHDDRIKVRRLETNRGIAGATNAALKLARGDWIAFMDHDDLLRGDALALIADGIVNNPAARLIYTDEDKIDEHGNRFEPYMKGGWNRELFYAQNYLNHLSVIRKDVVDATAGLRPEYDGSQDYDLLLRCIEAVGEEAILHLPFVCYHWRFATERVNFSETQKGRSFNAAIRALNDHFARTGLPAVAEPAPNLSYTRVRWALNPKPLVSIIIPTRDRRELLETAIRSIRAKTTYPNYELLIADNDSREPETLAYLDMLQRAGVATVVPAPGPFNFSRINNVAAGHAHGEILAFVNNDIEIRNPEWLDELTSHFARPEVAAAGAKLLYADGRIQHAGVVTGIGGVAGHLFKFSAGDAPGPFSLLSLAREVNAATAACLLVRKHLFHEVGGFNETNLAVAFNDIDLCLKLRHAGGRIVWTPFAELTHFESVSRGSDQDPEKQNRFHGEVRHMLSVWGSEVLAADPYYSPNLTLGCEDGSLAMPPRIRRPWD